jgi:chromate transport protein ChrA
VSSAPVKPTKILSAESSRPSLGALAWIVARTGLGTFGSGNTTSILLARRLEERGWFGPARQPSGAWSTPESNCRRSCQAPSSALPGDYLSAEFDLCFTMARAVPGTNLFAYLAAVGWRIRGWPGALLAVAALSLPASAVVILFTLAYQAWHTHPLGRAAIEAAMACIVGVMAAGAWWLIKPRIRSARTAVLVLGAVLLSHYLSPLAIMSLAAVLGYFWQEST